MNVLLLGQTGVKKSDVWQNLRSVIYQQGSTLESRDVAYCEVEDKIQAGFATYLTSNAFGWQKAEWNRAWQVSLSELETYKPTYKFLTLHAVLFHKGRFFIPWELNSFSRFNPDFIVTLIDDCYSICHRVDEQAKRTGFKFHIRLREAISWRYFETCFGELIAQYINEYRLREKISGHCYHYIIPVKHTPQMLYKLLFQWQNLMIVYASFPISAVRKSAESRKFVDNFREQAGQRYIVFDPLAMDETVIGNALKRKHGGDKVELYWEDRWSVAPSSCLCDDSREAYPMRFETSEVKEALQVVESLVVERDFRFIEKADCVAAYRPYFGHHKRPSAGMSDELAHALDVVHIDSFIYDPQEDHRSGRPTFRPGQVTTVDKPEKEGGLEEFFRRLDQYQQENLQNLIGRRANRENIAGTSRN